MNWAAITIGIGLAVVAAVLGPVGWFLLAAGAWWLWRRG